MKLEISQAVWAGEIEIEGDITLSFAIQMTTKETESEKEKLWFAAAYRESRDNSRLMISELCRQFGGWSWWEISRKSHSKFLWNVHTSNRNELFFFHQPLRCFDNVIARLQLKTQFFYLTATKPQLIILAIF